MTWRAFRSPTRPTQAFWLASPSRQHTSLASRSAGKHTRRNKLFGESGFASCERKPAKLEKKGEPPMSTATITDRSLETSAESNRFTETLEERLNHPATSSDFDLKKAVNEVLADVGMSSDDCGGELNF